MVLVLRVVEVAAHLEPGLRLVVGGQAGRQTVLVGTFLDTLLVQIAERGEVVHLAGHGAGHGHVVFLAETLLEAFLLPVVRLEPESLAVIHVERAEGGLGVHRAALEDEVLAARNGVDHIAGTGRGALHVGVGLGMGFRRGSAVQHRLVVDGLVIGLVELLRIGGFVQLQRIGVDTPLDVEGHLGVAGLAALGGDHDDAVRAAGAVQGVGGGVLEDRHRLDIRRVDEVQVAVIGHAVHDDQRRGVGGIGADTADGDGRGGTQLAGCVVDLDTGHAARESLGGVGDLGLGQFVGFHHARGTGEGFALHLTESDDHDVVQHLGVLLEDDGETGLPVHRDLAGHITHAGYLQRRRRRDADGEITVQVGHHAVGRGARLKDSCSDDGRAGRILDHAVHRRLSPSHHAGCQEQEC